MSDHDVVVSVRDVSKRFIIRKEKSLKERVVNFGRSNKHKEDFWALKNVALEITAGCTIGLIGANGSGKSTLLKTIGGIIQPTSGEVLRRGRLAALLELGAGFHPDLTGRENVYLNASILGITRKETDEYFDAIVEFSGIGDFIDTQVKFYSSGMYVRLAFAVAVHVDPDILIVDEVLAVGDEPFQRKCMDRIRAFQRAGKTIILVTHSLAQVGELCDRAIVLDHGSVVYDGDPQEAIQTLRDGFENARQKTESAKADKKASGARGKINLVSTELAGVTSDDQLDASQSLQWSVRVDSDLPISDAVIGMGIETPLGQSVFGTNTELLGIDVFVDRSSTEVRFDLGNLNLGPGQYVLHASVGTKELGEVSRDAQAAIFHVRVPNRNVGVINASCAVTVLEGSVLRSQTP